MLGQMSIFDFLETVNAEKEVALERISFTDEEISDMLRYGSNNSHSRERIISQFERQKSIDEIADMLRREFHGGYGIHGSNGKYCAWYAVDGIHLARGNRAKESARAQVISWKEAANRIRDMLEAGTFTSNEELADADRFVRFDLALHILYLYHDLSERAKKIGFFPSLLDLPAGYPEAVANLSAQMSDPAYVKVLRDEYADFLKEYKYDEKLLRFHYHKLYKIQQELEDLLIPRREYVLGMDQIPEIEAFITEDEINILLGEGGRKRIYNYFSKDHSPKEKSDFLKNEYGNGGHSHALSGADHSHEDHDAKGINLKKENCPEIRISWPEAVSRIEKLINEGKYPVDAD